MSKVLVTGTFNLLHAGHIELLEFASRFGPVVVGVNAQWYLDQKYGEHAVPLVNRVKVVKACRYVDEVLVFKEADPSQLILKVKPRYFVRGPDYWNKELPEQDALDAVGAELLIHHTNKIGDSSKLVIGADAQVFDPLDPMNL